MATFSDESWENPESSLSADEFCACSLVDTNPAGQGKIKTLCKLPYKKTPDGPANRNALRNCASRIFQMTGVSPEDKRAAARKLVRLMREAGIDVGDSVLRLAGQRSK